MTATSDERTLHWQAIDSNRNIARDYRLTVSRDLFGWIVVDREWGRIGTRLRTMRETFVNEKEADRRIRAIIKRRSNAECRIGAVYRQIKPAA